MTLGIYERDMVVNPSLCGADGKLAVWETFSLFMDIAAEHAYRLGIGYKFLKSENLFWITAKTRIKFNRRPDIEEEVKLVTWPEVPERIRCIRDYEIVGDDEVLVSGKTEWVVMNMETGKFSKTKDIYPEDMEILDKVSFDDPFSKMDSSFEGEEFGQYKVSSTDIDVGGHMNNAAYLSAFASTMSMEEWKNMEISDIEVVFKSQCYEGDTIIFKKKEDEGRTVVQAFVGENAVLQIIFTEK